MRRAIGGRVNGNKTFEVCSALSPRVALNILYSFRRGDVRVGGSHRSAGFAALATGVRDGVQSLPGAALCVIHPPQQDANVHMLGVHPYVCKVNRCPFVRENTACFLVFCTHYRVVVA